MPAERGAKSIEHDGCFGSGEMLTNACTIIEQRSGATARRQERVLDSPSR
jgi:hypothetical protein